MKAYWIESCNQKNYEICLTKTVGPADNASIAIIAKYTYNLYVNGEFVCYGPARTASGYARVDRIDITDRLTKDKNVISLFCLSVEMKTLCFSGGRSFVGCELVLDGCTYDAKDFSCYRMTDRVDRVERMSAQRGYVEVYRQTADRNLLQDCIPDHLIEQEMPRLLERCVPYAFNQRSGGTLIKQGTATMDNPEKWGASLVNFLTDCNTGDFYPLSACEEILYQQLQKIHYREDGMGNSAYRIFDFGKTYCGKIEISIAVETDVTLWVTYDDLLIDGYVYFGREQIIHGLKWTLKKGVYTLHSSEVYAMRYLSIVSDGPVDNIAVNVIRIENPVRKENNLPDPQLAMVYDAAQNTFCQNAYDLYTDCPSRERAGWLCDSFFTAKAERYFTGNNVVERNFLENYLLYDGASFKDAAILPACFPSSPGHENDFIPNWMLWLLVELEDYLKRTGDEKFVLRFTAKIRKILSYFSKFENEYGFLENLHGWVFLEWSHANDFMSDVNFPSNMLYCGALKSAGRILKDDDLLKKADTLRDHILAFSYNGEYFYDNALRKDGNLITTDNISETCQYFAALFDIAPDKKEFVEKLAVKFDPFAPKSDGFAPSPMFIGYIVRLLLLFENGHYERLLHECKAKFLPMAEKTGTIWEFFDESASCNHGFGSIIGYFVAEADEKCRKTIFN